jgi:hypothetical protein
MISGRSSRIRTCAPYVPNVSDKRNQNNDLCSGSTNFIDAYFAPIDRRLEQSPFPLVAPCGHTAIDDDFRSSDEARLVGSEEQCCVGRVAAITHEAERDPGKP